MTRAAGTLPGGALPAALTEALEVLTRGLESRAISWLSGGDEPDTSSAEQAFSCVRDAIDRRKVLVVVDQAPGSAQGDGRQVLVTMAPNARRPRSALITVGTPGGGVMLFADRWPGTAADNS